MRNKGLFACIIGVLALIIAVFGATYAWFGSTVGSANETVVTAGTLEIGYTDGSTLVASNLKPASIAQVQSAYIAGQCVHGADTTSGISGEKICSVYQFTVTNTGSLTAKLSASTSNFTITPMVGRLAGLETAVTTQTEVANGYFKYQITATAPGNAITLTGSPLASANTLTLATSSLISHVSTTQYLVIWLDQTAGNSYQGISVTSNFSVTGNQTNK